MKKRDGFTLIELIVGMAIMAIIFGGIVMIFGASTKAMQAGQNQQQAYEDARTTMDVLKTSLRYAVKATSTSNVTDPASPSLSTTKLTYVTKRFDKHWDYDNGTNNVYDITVEMVDGYNPDGTTKWSGTKKQLLITVYNEITKKTEKPIRYPKYAANSTFTGTNDFPIILGENGGGSGNTYGTDQLLYKITLPVKYNSTIGDKVDTLESRVQPIASDAYDASQGGGTGSSTNPDAQAEVLLKAVVGLYNNDNSKLRVKNGQYSSNISSGAYKQPNFAGITKNLIDQINPEGIAILGDTAWVIASLNASGNVVNSSQNEIYGYRIFIAKNAINDVKSVWNASDATKQFNDAAMAGNYIIRDGFGMLTYVYDCVTVNNKPTATIKGPSLLGYTTGIKINSNIMIDYNSWVGNYLNLKQYNSLGNTNYNVIEDQYNLLGTILSQGKYTRIDYDEHGYEYTVGTCKVDGTTYKYDKRTATYHAN